MSEYQNLWVLSHLSESIDVPAECSLQKVSVKNP